MHICEPVYVDPKTLAQLPQLVGILRPACIYGLVSGSELCASVKLCLPQQPQSVLFHVKSLLYCRGPVAGTTCHNASYFTDIKRMHDTAIAKVYGTCTPLR